MQKTLSFEINGVPDRNRTCGLKLRRFTLYPTELRARKAYTMRQNCALVKQQKNNYIRPRKYIDITLKIYH